MFQCSTLLSSQINNGPFHFDRKEREKNPHGIREKKKVNIERKKEREVKVREREHNKTIHQMFYHLLQWNGRKKERRRKRRERERERERERKK